MKLGKMKKILAALTAGVLCMGAVPLSAASLPEAVLSVSAVESTYENLTYTTEEDGTVTITGCSADVSGELELPAEIGGKSVTRIGDSAFQGNTAITGVSVPDSVNSIGDSAFAGCTALTHIDLPQTMTSFGREVFNTCTSLEKITIPEGITSLPAMADTEMADSWYGFLAFCTSLKEVQLPSTLKTIDEAAFYSCTALESLQIPEGVTEIKDYAFGGCEGLTSLQLPDSVTRVGNCAFLSCTQLTTVTFPAQMTSMGKAVFNSCTALETIAIPEGITSLAAQYYPDDDSYSGFFLGCTSLKEVKLPSTLEVIDGAAFYNCYALETVDIPDSVTQILSLIHI